MAIYPFNCDKCGKSLEVAASIKAYDSLCPPVCCGTAMEQTPTLVTTVWKTTPGRDSGVYDLDYGKRATEDLTIPGKFERLQRAGTVADPFAE